MESGSISPEEFRKLKMQVDILQKFLIRTFGSSFLEFCKEAQSTLLKESKPPPPLNKAQSQTGSPLGKQQQQQSNGSTKVKPQISVNGHSNGTNRVTTTTVTANRRPPPLLHRPNTTLVKVEQKSSASASYHKNSVIGSENGDQTEYYDNDEPNEDDMVQFIQPETVFSDDEHQGSKVPALKKLSPSTSGRNGVKRDHAVAFGYEDEQEHEEQEMTLPEGTECIVIESDEDGGQGENYLYSQDQQEEYYDDAATEEMYDEEGYSYSMVEDGLEVTTGEANTENYQAEELKTDGNVTFGTVYTDPSSGMQYFQCSFCPSAKVFKHKQSLKEHYLLNHSPTPPAYQCQCGRRFLKQSQLKRHEVVHTAERPYVCPVCFKDFTRKDNMTVHMVRNHAEKKHQCPHCSKVYATPAEVNRHLRMYHSQWQQ